MSPEPRPEVARLLPYTVPAAGRRGLLRLDFNENLMGPSPRVLERLRGLEGEDLSFYPDETGAREAVARHFALGADDALVLTSGVDEAIRLVCDCYVRPGERVVILEPGYAMYRFYATLAGAEVREVDFEAGLLFPEAALRRALAAGGRVLLIGNPNNPTGTPVPEGLLEELAAAHPETVILADEAYVEFGGRSCLEGARRLPNLLVARTFSKAYGLAGLRAGVLLGRREPLSWIARIRSPYAVNSVALALLPAALEDAAYLRRTVEEVAAARRLLADGLREAGIETWPSAANFLIARFGENAKGLRDALKRRGVLVRDRSGHPLLHGTLRIGIGTRVEAEAFLRALRDLRGGTAGEERT